jgi:hypothetical protein
MNDNLWLAKVPVLLLGVIKDTVSIAGAPYKPVLKCVLGRWTPKAGQPEGVDKL